MTWVYLDDGFPDHRKVVSAGGDAAWLHVSALCYVNRNLTGGLIPAAMVPRLSDRKSPKKLATVLVNVGLWEEHERGYRIHDYEDYNQSAERQREKEDAAKVARSEHARKAALARWGEPDQVMPEHDLSNARAMPEQCPTDAQSMPDGMPEQCSTDAYAGARDREPLAPSPSTQSLLKTQSGEQDGGPDPNVRTEKEKNGQNRRSEAPSTSGVELEDPILKRFVDVWPGRNRGVACLTVLAEVRVLFDDSLIDEGIGHMLAMEKPPRSPAYLRSLLADWGVQRGAYEAGDERIVALRKRV